MAVTGKLKQLISTAGPDDLDRLFGRGRYAVTGDKRS